VIARTAPPGRYLLLWAFTLAAAAFILSPLAIVVLNSFSSVAYNVFPPPGFSTQWYRNLAGQEAFYGAAIRSVTVAVASSALALVVGTMASYALVRYKLPGHDAIKAFLLSPIVMPKIVLGTALFIFFLRIGQFDTPQSLVLAHALVSMPFAIALISAAMFGFDWTLEEAALDLGASRLQTFLRVILPQISTSLAVAGLFCFIISFDQVETTIFLVRPSSHTLPIEMFIYMQKWQDPTIAALSTVMIGFSIVFVAVTGLVLRRVDLSSALGRGVTGGRK
jgi:putative spermidine/putrescine transport system permease protein